MAQAVTAYGSTPPATRPFRGRGRRGQATPRPADAVGRGVKQSGYAPPRRLQVQGRGRPGPGRHGSTCHWQCQWTRRRTRAGRYRSASGDSDAASGRREPLSIGRLKAALARERRARRTPRCRRASRHPATSPRSRRTAGATAQAAWAQGTGVPVGPGLSSAGVTSGGRPARHLPAAGLGRRLTGGGTARPGPGPGAAARQPHWQAQPEARTPSRQCAPSQAGQSRRGARCSAPTSRPSPPPGRRRSVLRSRLRRCSTTYSAAPARAELNPAPARGP